jgi:ParB family chromosome partitioning protein
MASERDHTFPIKAKLDSNNLDALGSIALTSINSADNTFRITTESGIHELAASIQLLGLLHPPTLRQCDTGYKIISGFRRIAACRKIGMSEIPALILSPETSDANCALYAIADNSLQRALNLVEISSSLALLTLHFKDEKLLLELASRLCLAEHRTHVEKIRKICHLPKPIQDGILADTISLTVALDLSELEPDTGVALVRLFDQLNMGLNKQRQLILLFNEIALRENRTVLGLLNEKVVRKILDNSELDRIRKSTRLFSYLKQRRYPTITQSRMEFERHLKALKLGKTMTLMPPRDFEGSTYSLTLRFDSHAELTDLQTKLDRVVQSDGLKKFFNGKME